MPSRTPLEGGTRRVGAADTRGRTAVVSPAPTCDAAAPPGPPEAEAVAAACFCCSWRVGAAGGGGDDALGPRPSACGISMSRAHRSQSPRHSPSSEIFFVKRLQSVGTVHSAFGTRVSEKPTALSASYVGMRTAWSMAIIRHRPTLMCLFFLCGSSTDEGSAACKMRS